MKLKNQKILNRFCNPDRVLKIGFSTYADDISISFLLKKNTVLAPNEQCFIDKHKIACFIEKELKRYSFKLNLKKTRLFTEKRGFKITGVTLSNSGLTVSRKTYANLRAKMYNYINDTFTIEKESTPGILEFQRITGLVSHIASMDVVKADRLSRYFRLKVLTLKARYAAIEDEYACTLLKENTAQLEKAIQDVPYEDIITLNKLRVIR